MLAENQTLVTASPQTRAEVVVDQEPMSGPFNMSMDAAMLELGATREVSVIRIYQWREPTVSIGYFQPTTEASPFPKLPTVRRLSGGGAILHDLEITYSCTLPPCHPVRQDPSSLYEIVHQSLIKLLLEFGVRCMLRREFDSRQPGSTQNNSVPTERAHEEPFLCFLRSNPNDIVHESGVKIVGSAQRRRRGITMQHGSILLSASRFCPAVRGIQQLAEDFDVANFSAKLPGCIAESISHQWSFRSYSDAERLISAEFLSNST